MLKNLRAARLVTLTGPGGVGKTRLATEASGRLDVTAWFVPLAPVTDPAEVAYAVLDTLDIREPVIARRAAGPGAGPLDRLAAALGDRDEVMVLDNCEHVIEAAAALAGHVLAACPRMRILATSRQPLRIDGETLCPVPPLPVPPASSAPSVPLAPVTVASYGSVRLLRDRAVAVRPDFELDEANAAAVARICRALDGMPLAIELAAVWLRTLTPAQLAERLDDRFALLTGGSRTALPRHRTLRAVVDWSWDLLSASEQVLARRLAVFPGGATLAAAEHVCADELLPPAAVLPALSGLVDKSILGVAEGPDGLAPRYRMLETVRAYGLERLADAGEEAAVRDAFTAYYLDLAETADPGLRAAGQGRWLRELTTEQDNLHAALRWTIARQEADTALRFVRALGWYWMLRGQPGEPEVLARQVLAFEPREQTLRMAEARVVCAITAAGDSWEIDTVQPALAAAVADLNHWSPDTAPSHPIAAMGEPMLTLYEGDPDRAFAVFDRYLTSEDPWVRAAVPLLRGTFGSMLGRMDWAESDCRDALDAFRALGEAWGMAAVLIQLAEFARLRGENAAAVAALEEAGALGRQLGAWGDLSHIGGKLAAVRLRTGDLAGARADLERAEREESARGIGQSDSAIWLGLVRAELLYCRGRHRRGREDLHRPARPAGGEAVVLVVRGAGDHPGQAGGDRAGGRGRSPLPRPAGGGAPDRHQLGGAPAGRRRDRRHRHARPALGRMRDGRRDPARHRPRAPGLLRRRQPRRAGRAGRGPRRARRGWLRGRLRARPPHVARRGARPGGRRGREPGHGPCFLPKPTLVSPPSPPCFLPRAHPRCGAGRPGRPAGRTRRRFRAPTASTGRPGWPPGRR